VVGIRTSRYEQPISQDEQKLYDHLLYWIEFEPPNEMLKRFRRLFIDGAGYSDPEVFQALKAVVSSERATEDFHYILNRCCHILINRWQVRPQSQSAIPQLIRLFETPPAATLSATHSRSVRRLHQLIRLFTQTEQYLTLSRLAQVLTEAAEAATVMSNRPLGTLIRRYPYLYEHCLLSENSSPEQQYTVRQVQAARQRQFELDLFQYATYQMRRSQRIDPTGMSGERRIIQPIANPTLLEERALGQAIQHYLGKVDGYRTHRDLALNFLTHSQSAQSFAAFKDDLYQYITAGVDPGYGRQKFNHQLYNCLQNTLPDSNSQRLNDFLLVRTCNHLLSFLVADHPKHPSHFIFVDLLTNLGPTLTIGLLLKVVLLCRKVKPCLEKRFSILFDHYETYSRDTVQWLIQALENLNVALTTNFGSVNLSCVH
jgi:hypothetical protein